MPYKRIARAERDGKAYELGNIIASELPLPRPGGTRESSPAFQCRVWSDSPRVPKGRLRRRNFSRPFGTREVLPLNPALKCRAIVIESLRDQETSGLHARRLNATTLDHGARAAVLFEVLLALILFAAAAAVVTTAFNSSVSSLERQKLGSQALNLAASVIAEVQLGIRPGNSDSPRPLEPPFQDWTWETALTPTETADGGLTGLTRLEVIIRHQKSTTVQRLAQVVKLKAGASSNSVAPSPQI